MIFNEKIIESIQDDEIPLNISNELIDLNDYAIKKKIKLNSSSKIFKISSKATGENFLAQIIIVPNYANIDQIINNIKILSKMYHPNLLKIIGYSKNDFKNKPNPVIITEIAKKRKLIDFIQEHNECINDTMKLICIYGIASALSYLHSQNIVIEKFRISDIFLDKFLYPKIFNLKIQKEGETESTKKSNVYSFGMIVFEIMDEEEILTNVSYQELIEKCTSYDSKIRPTFDDILKNLKSDKGFVTKNVEIIKFDHFTSHVNESLEKFIKSINSTVKFNEYQSKKDKFIDLNHYKIIRTIGDGQFGVVFLVKKISTNELFAAKVLKNQISTDYKENDNTLNYFREIKLMSIFHHPSIVKFFGFSPFDFQELSYPTMIIEYVPSGTLRDILNLEKCGLSPKLWDETKKLITIYGIANVMFYLHSNNVIHRDLKPENILMDENLFPKLSDFGFAKFNLDKHKGKYNESVTHESEMKNIKGTPKYMSPEAFEHKSEEAGDVFAFSILLYEILTLSNPYPYKNYFELVKRVAINGERPKLTRDIPKSFQALICKCWESDPFERPTFKEIVFDLKTNESYLNDCVDEIEYYNYINFIDESNSYFDLSRSIRFEEIKEAMISKIIQEGPINYIRKFTFYFTGVKKNQFLEEFDIELNLSMNYEQCHDKLLEKLREKNIDVNNKYIIIYFAGGIPFISGTLHDYYFIENVPMKNVMYGVLIRAIDSVLLNKPCNNICNITDQDNKLLISPLCESSEIGLMNIACILGYLSYYGEESKILSQSFSLIIQFPPFTTSMYKTFELNNFVGRDIATICSVLFSYFRPFLPETEIKDKNVFEYTLNFCNLISKNKDLRFFIHDNSQIIKIDAKDNESVSKLNIGPICCFIKEESFKDQTSIDFKIQKFEEIKNANQIENPFTPISPSSIHMVPARAIIQGKNCIYLNMMPSQLKGIQNRYKYNVINPLTGMIETKDIETLKEENSTVDSDFVEQIIMFNLDESKSMIGSLDGYYIPNNSIVYDHRITIANQLLTIITSQLHNFHISYMQGLVTFNNRIKLRYPLSPSNSKFDCETFKEIKPHSTSKLWDSILFSCREIVKFRKNESGKNIYHNAISRIIVITDGDDIGSTNKVSDVVKELKKENIIVDCFVLSEEYVSNMICAVCHATDGCAFKIENVEDGLSIVEHDSFIRYEERKKYGDPLVAGIRTTIPSRLKPDMITEDFMNEVEQNAWFDKNYNIISRSKIQCESMVRLATPRHRCEKSKDHKMNGLIKRLLYELHLAIELNEQTSQNYDPDLKIFIHDSYIDIWKVYLKGPDGSLYENKWWFLYVTFPSSYPYKQPDFKFCSVPYHLNISPEGKICHDIIEKGYTASKHVVNILQELKEIFLVHNFNTPIRIDAYCLFAFDPEKYKKLAMESAKMNAKDDYKEYNSSLVFDEVPSDYNFQETHLNGHHLVSQISSKPIEKEKLIKASSGILYDKDELRRYISISKNPICVVTGKVLTDKLEDLKDPDSI